MSPPRLLIPVLGAIELISIGMSIGVEIVFGTIPYWLIIYTIHDPVTTEPVKLQLTLLSSELIKAQLAGPKLI
jgi:hypothetical protein